LVLALRFPLAAVTALVVTAAALPGCGGGGDTAQRTGFGARRPPAPLRRDFALFRGTVSARDRLPQQLVPADVVHRLALDPAAARLAYSAAFNRIYAVPGRRAVCLFDTRAASSPCWPPDTVAKGMAVSTSFCPPSLPAGTMETVGLVPDGVSKVQVVMEDGRRRTAAVAQNFYLLDFRFGRSLPSRLTWRRAGEVHEQTAGVSPRIAKVACASQRRG
jgi:hypothetical protein